MTSIVLALLSSLSFAISNIFIHRGLSGMDFFTGLLVNLVTNSVLLWLFLVLFTGPFDLWIPANMIFVGVGLTVPGLSRFFLFKGMERLGSSISSCLVNSSPLFAIVFAMSFLAERPSPANLLGALSIVFGIIFLSWQGPTKTWRTRDLLFPLAAALLFAIRDNLVRFGLLIIHSPLLGASIAASTSAVTMGIFYWAVAGHLEWAKCNRRGAFFFFLSGVMNFFSYIFMYTALSREQVSVVSPLVNCSSLFVLPLAYFLLKDIEQITARKVQATVMVVFGVLLISWEKF